MQTAAVDYKLYVDINGATVAGIPQYIAAPANLVFGNKKIVISPDLQLLGKFVLLPVGFPVTGFMLFKSQKSQPLHLVVR